MVQEGCVLNFLACLPRVIIPPMQVGKLPPDFLHRLLSLAPPTDSRVLIGPGIGEDAAVISMAYDRVLVAKTDPITFASDEIGWYSVHVNANDIAATGAEPRWFLATLLAPENTPESWIENAFLQIYDACKDIGVSLIGGHTEITYDINRPIVMGAMLGEAYPGDLTPTSAAQVGDAVLLTKAIAIEGTAVLARESASILSAKGVPATTIESAQRFLYTPGISVLKDARTARGSGEIHSMHDPTEGGLVTGLREIGWAAGVGVTLDLASVPILPETRVFCQSLDLDPLGLLASGALIVTLSHEHVPAVTAGLEGAGIPVARIGEVTSAEQGFVMRTAMGEREMPNFAIDELARFLSSQ